MSLFRKKKSNELQSTGIITKNKDVVRSTPTLRVHGDLEGLLWIAEGPKKNYTEERSEASVIDLGDYKISISFSGTQEPSLISTKLPVAVNPVSAEKLPYYPSYLEMSPKQRGMYWKFLENPYNPSFEIGYVFVLYYGLERCLLLGDYERAMSVIIKLRDVHSNGSFQAYSADAIILTCLKNKRADLLYTFLRSLDKQYEYNMSHNLYLFSKYSLELPLNADDIIRMTKSFEFTKISYIKNYPDLFKKTLTSNMIATFGKPEVLCSQFINKADYRKLPKENVRIFANVSIIDKQIEVPLIIHAFHFKKAMYELLNQTHEDVKKCLAEMRKSGESPQKATSTNSQKKVVETFDSKREAELLKKYNSCNPGTLHEHFASIELQDFYYKYRNLDDKYLQKCINYCNDDVTKLQSINEDYVATERARIIEHAKWLGTSKTEIEGKLAKIGLFNCTIPAFKRLAIIYEKQKNYDKAIAVCDSAIRYYSIVKNHEGEEAFKSRKEKIQNKK